MSQWRLWVNLQDGTQPCASRDVQRLLSSNDRFQFARANGCEPAVHGRVTRPRQHENQVPSPELLNSQTEGVQGNPDRSAVERPMCVPAC